MRTREGNSPNWVQIGEAYCNKPVSIRALAKHHGVSDTAVRKEAKKRGWTRLNANQPSCEPECKPDREPTQARSPEAIRRTLAALPVSELTARGRNIILDLMSELEFQNRNHETIAGMVEDYVNGEKDSSARAKLLKVLDLETRCKNANQLATALAKLNDAAPGKKAQAQAAAETAGQGSGWGDDLDTGITGRPN